MGSKKLLLINYKGKAEGKTCSICKLEIREKQSVCQCPYCEYLFHKEHIMDWLETQNDCPVCNNIIQYKPLITDEAVIAFANREDQLQQGPLVTFQNPSNGYKSLIISLRIISVAIALLFIGVSIRGFIFIFRSETFEKESIPIVGAILAFGILLGIVLLVVPQLKIVNEKYKWKSIIFIEEGILIEQGFLNRIKKSG